MTATDAPIPRKKKIKNSGKEPKSNKNTSVPKEKGQTYGDDHLNIGEPVVKSENDSK